MTKNAPTTIAMTTAISGLTKGRKARRSETEGRRHAAVSVDTFRRSHARGFSGVVNGIVQPAHVATDLLHIGLVRIEVGHDAPAIDHQDSVRQRKNLVDIRRDHEDGTPSVPHINKNAMDRLDRADVDALRRLLCDNQACSACQLPRKLDL